MGSSHLAPLLPVQGIDAAAPLADRSADPQVEEGKGGQGEQAGWEEEEEEQEEQEEG